jgi:hypothetical protein
MVEFMGGEEKKASIVSTALPWLRELVEVVRCTASEKLSAVDVYLSMISSGLS